MSRPLVVRPDARRDVYEIRDYLKEKRPSAADKFESRITGLLLRIASMPFMYGKLWRNVRAVKVPGFRYVLFYVVFANRIEVIAVTHGSRDSSSWKSRI